MQRGARPAVRAARPALRPADLSAAQHNPVDIPDVVLDAIFLEESVDEPGGEWTQRKGAVTAEDCCSGTVFVQEPGDILNKLVQSEPDFTQRLRRGRVWYDQIQF
ncbi:hypothetical protein E5288_WYG020907 [Bos mutus]|uniref:Uncharacterized protein n=1 Tax=Bos mutus TaxID=72004 RepID=A0A6B0R6E8_9CETA|nr:hypothetical protein [Bos mutus]